ncbi:MAG: E3 binding domain-containing protein, partial [Myxococcales bacterium]|nr:E3 binding domain-containing protein [Myxococcales bacterium]
MTLPQLGESVAEGTISKWLVHEGDVVKKDQPIVSVATDKADSDLPSPAAGRVAKLLASEGQVVPVKTVIAQIDEAVGAGGTLSVQPGPPRSIAPPAVIGPPPPVPTPPAPPAVAGPPGAARGTLGALATPTVRKTALEHDVDLASVQGTGERGRVTRDDVIRAAAGGDNGEAPSPAAHAQAAVGPAPPPEVKPAPQSPRTQQLAQLINGGGGFVPPIPGVGFGSFKVPAYRATQGDKVVPFTRRRRITADHMVYSK